MTGAAATAAAAVMPAVPDLEDPLVKCWEHHSFGYTDPHLAASLIPLPYKDPNLTLLKLIEQMDKVRTQVSEVTKC